MFNHPVFCPNNSYLFRLKISEESLQWDLSSSSPDPFLKRLFTNFTHVIIIFEFKFQCQKSKMSGCPFTISFRSQRLTFVSFYSNRYFFRSDRPMSLASGRRCLTKWILITSFRTALASQMRNAAISSIFNHKNWKLIKTDEKFCNKICDIFKIFVKQIFYKYFFAFFHQKIVYTF